MCDLTLPGKDNRLFFEDKQLQSYTTYMPNVPTFNKPIIIRKCNNSVKCPSKLFRQLYSYFAQFVIK